MRMARRRSTGFTLVEVLVALTVLSLIVVATLGALRTFADTQHALQLTTTRVDEMRSATAFLRNTLRQAVAVTPAISFSQYFDGAEQEVSWVAPMLGAGSVSGLQFIRLYRAGGALNIQFTPHRPELSEPEWGGARAYELLQQVDSFSLAYRETAAAPWVDRWSLDELGIPQAVRLRIRARERFWPDMVIVIDQHGRSS